VDPLSHAAFAYLWYVGVAALTDRRLPARDALVPLFVASQLPDLIDKPLAYGGVLASGRSLGHSLLAFAVLVLAVWLLCREFGRVVASARTARALALAPVAFAVGYAAHLVGDAYRPLLAGAYADAAFLLYPFVPARTYPNDGIPPWVRLRRIYLEGGGDVVWPLVLVAAAVFVGLRATRWGGRPRRG
jgi:hypothetical protein